MPKKDLIRTIRMAEGLMTLLQADARDSGVSANSLINSILQKYAEWDRFADRFGFISLDKGTFREIINSIPEDRIRTISASTGVARAMDMRQFWFGKDDEETFGKFDSLISRHMGLYQREVKQVGGQTILVYHHDLGKKWSAFLGEGLLATCKQVLGAVPEVKVTDTEILIRFASLDPATKEKLSGD